MIPDSVKQLSNIGSIDLLFFIFKILIFQTIISLLSIQVNATAIEIPLNKHGGVYTLPVRINRVITLDFMLDSGAAEVVIPEDVVRTLLRAKTIDINDFLPGDTYVLADGSTRVSPRFMLRELEIGHYKIVNVPASIGPTASHLLLGQSFLERVKRWSLDNQKHVLIIETDPIPGKASAPLEKKVIINYPHEATRYVKSMIDDARDEEKVMLYKNKIEQLRKPLRGNKERARKENDEALILMRQSKDAEAIPLLEDAHKADPLDAEITNNLASAYFATSFSNNDFSAAKAMLVETLFLKPDRSVAWANLGRTFAMEGNEYAAINCYINFYRFSRHREKALQHLAAGGNDPHPVLRKAFAGAYQYISVVYEKFPGTQ